MAAISANTTFALLVCLVLFQGENQQPFFDTDGGGGVCGTRSSMLAGLSCTKGVWYIYDWDTGSTILIW